MKNRIVLAAFVVVVMAFAASAQKVPDFSGKWNLDVSRSKLDERARIESQVMTVTQTDKTIKVETATKRLRAGEGAGAGRGQGRGGFGAGDVPAVFSLDGKETVVEEDSPMGGEKIPAKFQAMFEGDKLHLSQSRRFVTRMGEVNATIKAIWELSADGKTLTIDRQQVMPRGTVSMTMVYTRQ